MLYNIFASISGIMSRDTSSVRARGRAPYRTIQVEPDKVILIDEIACDGRLRGNVDSKEAPGWR